MNYLITGGAGFIGSHTAEKIVENGDHVKIIDDLSTGFLKNIDPILKSNSKQVKFIKGSITDLKLLKEECRGIDYIIHLAALTSVPRSIDKPLSSNRINIDGHLNVLIAARDKNVKRVVFSSSAAIYGNSKPLLKSENITPDPLSPYAVGKIAGEYYMKIFYSLYGLETVCLRYFNIFGSRKDPNSPYATAIPKFIKSMLSSKSPTIFGDGKQSRDFTHIDNIVGANLLACSSEKAPGEVINVACGKSVNLLSVVDVINDALGKNIKPKFAKARPGDIYQSCADISKAKEILNYEPKVNFSEGIADTVKWCKQNL